MVVCGLLCMVVSVVSWLCVAVCDCVALVVVAVAVRWWCALMFVLVLFSH